jgi:hypothetical protein
VVDEERPVRTLLYCLLRDLAPPPAAGIPGVDGRAVTFVRAAGLAAAVSAIEPVQLIPSVDRLADYARAVEAVFGHATVLPMRFGASFADEAEVARHVELHAPRLAEQLAELDGCAEMGLRVFSRDDEPPEARAPAAPEREPPAPPAATGRAYLEAVRRQLDGEDPLRARREAALAHCSRALGPLAVRQASEVGRAEAASFERLLASVPAGAASRPRALTLLASIHFLVRRELIPAFEQGFRDLRPQPGTELLISGPWPPYNFVIPVHAPGSSHMLDI